MRRHLPSFLPFVSEKLQAFFARDMHPYRAQFVKGKYYNVLLKLKFKKLDFSFQGFLGESEIGQKDCKKPLRDLVET